ncbi:4'-phosphopantetheinyl transferase superfamily protein [Kitasatospora sp. NPDC002227]|uniref:4'-phosphopantetheinyl transferase family protein n=1 Tax=Kitasatospora sp. NPDC002227 TaxID=3154773 RepID=UPI0033180CD7
MAQVAEQGPLVMVACTDAVLGHPEAARHRLNALEEQRAARFRREEDRRNFVAAHLLVRICATRLLGVGAAPLEFAQQCPDCGLADHGRPYLPGHPRLQVSLSHTRGVVAAAAGYGTVGVDVELPQRGALDAALLQRVLSPAETELVRAQPDPEGAFLRQWVRKEALIKVGRTTLDTMGEIDLSALPLSAEGQLRSRFEQLHFLDWTDARLGATTVVVAAEAPVLGTL